MGGAIGQTALVAAQAVGATVDLEARHDSQREAAERLGAGTVTGDYDVVIEAGGTASALARAVELCRPGGRVVLLGTYWEGGVVMPGMEICMKEIEMVPACMYARSGPSRDFDVAAAILASASVDLGDAHHPPLSLWRRRPKHSRSPRTGPQERSRWCSSRRAA